MKTVPFFVAVLALVSAVGTSAIGETASKIGDWTEFRGPTGQGISNATNLPLEWDEEKNVIWKKDLPGKGWSSPAISDGRIYVTAAKAIGDVSGKKQSKFKLTVENVFALHVLCLDERTGDVIWNKSVGEVPPETSIHPKNSHASPTPIVRGDRLYVHFGTYGTAALDLDGNVIWNKRVEYKPVHGGGGSPVLHKDLMIFNCDGGDNAFVVALDVESGNERWRTPREDFGPRTFSFSTPLIIEHNGNKTLVSPASNAVFGYDPDSGKQKWSVEYPNRWSVVPRPVFADGLILICTGYEGPPELLAIRPGGKGNVTKTHIAWREGKFVSHNPSPIVHEGAVYLVSDAGIATCRDLATGKLNWKKRLGDDHSASPFFAEGNIYFLSEEGVCTIIRANPDEFEKLGSNDMKQQTLASMVPLKDSLLLRTESSLYRIGR